MPSTECVFGYCEHTVFTTIFNEIFVITVECIKLFLLLLITYFLAIWPFLLWKSSSSSGIEVCSDETENLDEQTKSPAPLTSNSQQQTNFEEPIIPVIYAEHKQRPNFTNIAASSQVNCEGPESPANLSSNSQQQTNCEGPNIAVIYAELKKHQNLTNTNTIEIQNLDNFAEKVRKFHIVEEGSIQQLQDTHSQHATLITDETIRRINIKSSPSVESAMMKGESSGISSGKGTWRERRALKIAANAASQPNPVHDDTKPSSSSLRSTQAESEIAESLAEQNSTQEIESSQVLVSQASVHEKPLAKVCPCQNPKCQNRRLKQ